MSLAKGVGGKSVGGNGAVVIDSSAWIAIFAGSDNADAFVDAINDASALVVPSVTMLEVFKVLLGRVPTDDALRASAQMRLGEVVDLNAELALEAARIGHEKKLPMADAIIYATAERYGATVWTQDVDFEGLPNVVYLPAKTH